MKLLISGDGRSGTCWLAEIIRISKSYNFTGLPEDKDFFYYKDLPDLYATKLATDQGTFNWFNIDKFMTQHQDLKIIFSIRHPVRHVMAKMANTDTKNSKRNSKIPYYSVFKYLKTIRKMYQLYVLLKNKYSDRVFYTKLENRIIDTEKEIRNICKILNIKFEPDMLNAHKYTKNEYHQKRYGNKIDKSQAKICSSQKNAYDGFFNDKKDIIEIIKSGVDDIADYFGYDINEK